MMAGDCRNRRTPAISESLQAPGCNLRHPRLPPRFNRCPTKKPAGNCRGQVRGSERKNACACRIPESGRHRTPAGARGPLRRNGGRSRLASRRVLRRKSAVCRHRAAGSLHREKKYISGQSAKRASGVPFSHPDCHCRFRICTGSTVRLSPSSRRPGHGLKSRSA